MVVGRRCVVLAMLAACGVPVDIGVLDDGSSSEPGSSGAVSIGPEPDLPTSSEVTTLEPTSESDTDVAPPPVRHDFAMRFADLPEVGGGSTDTGGSSASSTTGDTDVGDTDPDALVIRATTGFATCEDPYGQLPCPAAWTYGFALPPALQFVGATGRLEEHAGLVMETGPELVDCGFGGGTLLGSFEITAIDDTHVAGRMFDLELTDLETEVAFDAPLCGA